MYETLFRSFINPLFEGVIKKRETLKLRDELEASQWLSTAEIQSIQWQNLQKLLAHAYQQVPYWEKVFRAVDMRPEDISSYADFCRLPLISRTILQENMTGMLARGNQGRLSIKRTGGSTGDPLTFYYDNGSYQHRVAMAKRGYGWANCEDGRRQFHLWGMAEHRKSAVTRIKTNLHRAILRHKYFNCLHFNDARKLACLQLMNRFKPRVIIAYPGALYRLARFIEDNDLKLTFTPDSIIAAAEKLFETQRSTIENVFRASCYNSYGSREFMLLAMECEAHDGLHVSSENIFLEIIGDDGQPVSPGEQGEIVVTDLHNYGMPFIRYRIGDQAVQGSPDDACPCGRGMPKIKDVTGRTLDIIRLPDGNEIPGEFFVRYVGRNPGVAQFRVTQYTRDRLVIELVVDHQFTEQVFNGIKKNLRKVLGDSVEPDFRFVDRLDATPTGKFRITVSFVDQGEQGAPDPGLETH